MKKIIVSAGLATVSAVGLQAVEAPGLTRIQTAKWWSVSAALRGFYDGNPLAQHSSVDYDGSWGLEIIPSVAANFPKEQTYVGISLEYAGRWFENRSDNNWDHNLTTALKLDHKFSPRYEARMDEVFTWAQEPTVLERGGVITAPVQLRTETSGVRNRVGLGFTALLTEQLGVSLGFTHLWYDYFQDKEDVRADSWNGTQYVNPLGLGSLAAVLNRMEYYPNIDLRYQARENLVGLVGYQFGWVDYTSDDPLAGLQDPITGNVTLIPGSIRSYKTHYVYLGGEYALSSVLSTAVRLGASHTAFDDLTEADAWNPYVDGSVTYQYLPGSQVTAGVRYQPSVTDVSVPGLNIGSLRDVTAGSEAFVLYSQVSHRITPKLTGRVLGTLQHTKFNGGWYDGDVDWLFLAGVNCSYQFNQWWSAEVGYNYDRLDSDLGGRGFTRNRGYIGVRATY
jgi:hypothetical protein